MKFRATLAIAFLSIASAAGAQTASPNTSANNSAAPAAASPSAADSSLRLLISVGDEAELNVYGAPDMTQKLLVNGLGEVQVPLLGSVHIAGLTAEEAGALIAHRLAEKQLISNPQVTLIVKQYSGQRVSITGEIARPGNYPILQARRLVDLILEAGGTTQRAGRSATIVRADRPGAPLVVDLGPDLMGSVGANTMLQAGDMVTVSRAGAVYVIGEVNRPGTFVLENNQNVTVLAALAMASGPTRAASLKGARIIRQAAASECVTTPDQSGACVQSRTVDLNRLLSGKGNDQPLQAEDILFIPSSKSKAASEKGLSSVLGILTSLAIYHF
jgi:polysaccharide export outer membrane protein